MRLSATSRSFDPASCDGSPPARSEGATNVVAPAPSEWPGRAPRRCGRSRRRRADRDDDHGQLVFWFLQGLRATRSRHPGRRRGGRNTESRTTPVPLSITRPSRPSGLTRHPPWRQRRRTRHAWRSPWPSPRFPWVARQRGRLEGVRFGRGGVPLDASGRRGQSSRIGKSAIMLRPHSTSGAAGASQIARRTFASPSRER